MIGGRIKVDLGTKRSTKLPHLNSDPQRRATAGRFINDGTRQFIRMIQELADAELREARPAERRRSDGPRYRDSFVVLPNKQDNINRLSGGFECNHPNALRLEFGTKAHQIEATDKFLVFPYQPGSTRSQRGGPPGNWPINFTTANRRKDFLVNHPGTKPFKFIERARRKYARAARGGTGRSRPMNSLK